MEALWLPFQLYSIQHSICHNFCHNSLLSIPIVKQTGLNDTCHCVNTRYIGEPLNENYTYPWIWNSVSVISQSGRYIPSYPRGWYAYTHTGLYRAEDPNRPLLVLKPYISRTCYLPCSSKYRHDTAVFNPNGMLVRLICDGPGPRYIRLCLELLKYIIIIINN